MNGLPALIDLPGTTMQRVAATPCMNGDARGWFLEIGVTGAWISDQDADRLARAMLFEGVDK